MPRPVKSDWQLVCFKLTHRGGILLRTGTLSDCHFLVGNDSVCFSAHKLIMAMASPVFEAMFFGSMSGREIVDITDVQPDAFQALLAYIYTDEVPIKSFNLAYDLFYTAEKYMMPHLSRLCSSYMICNLSPENACRAYEIAALFDESVLMEQAMQIIMSQTKDVIIHNSFNELELPTFVDIFSWEPMLVNSELDLFNALERYVKANEAKLKESGALLQHQESFEDHGPLVKILSDDVQNANDININISLANQTIIYDDDEDEPSSEISVTGETEATESSKTENIAKPSTSKAWKGEKDEENAKKSAKADVDELSIVKVKEENKTEEAETSEAKTITIRSVLKLIRFLTLTPEEFAEGPALSSLLTKPEILAIFMNISSKKVQVPMPKGFSNSREHRMSLIFSPYYEPMHKEEWDGTFQFTVTGFRNRDNPVISPPFYLQDVPSIWRIKMIPYYDCSPICEDKKYMGFFLQCNSKCDIPFVTVKVNVTMKMLTHVLNTKPLIRKYEHIFKSDTEDYGFPKFSLWRDALDQRFLLGNSITLEVHINGRTWLYGQDAVTSDPGASSSKGYINCNQRPCV